MMNVLLVGNSEKIKTMASQLMLDNREVCLHEKTIITAIRTLYSKKVDAVIISSKEMRKQKLDFISFIKERFSFLKIFISFDNGVNDFNVLPEDVSLLTSNGVGVVREYLDAKKL